MADEQQEQALFAAYDVVIRPANSRTGRWAVKVGDGPTRYRSSRSHAVAYARAEIARAREERR